MSETKPQKRLVSKGQYVRIMGMQIGMYSLGTFLLIVGTLCLLYCVCAAVVFVPLIFSSGVFLFVILAGSGVFSGCLAHSCFRHSKKLLMEGKAMGSVASITNHNAHLLPAEETLLRGSDLPKTVQQAELLRATQAGQETPKEQLLRATTGEE